MKLVMKEEICLKLNSVSGVAASSKPEKVLEAKVKLQVRTTVDSHETIPHLILPLDFVF